MQVNEVQVSNQHSRFLGDHVGVVWSDGTIET